MKEYLIVTTIFLLSTSVYFNAHIVYLVVAFLILGTLFIIYGKRSSKDFIVILIALTILNVANIIVFDFVSFRTVAGNYIRFILPFFAVMLVGNYFPQYFIRVVKFFTIVSFVFYIPANIFPDFNGLLQNIPKFLGTDPSENLSFIIYRIEFARPWETNIPLLRNSGPTGEPGEFSGYLILAMIFEFIINKTLWTKNNILFTIALITTFSTSGYIAFFILLSSHFLFFSKVKGRMILFPLSVLLAFNIYFNFEFMFRKVDQQIQMITDSDEINEIPRDGRLPNVIRNLDDSFENPIFGKGRNFETRYENWETMRDDEFSNNTAAFPVQFGWPFFLFYTVLIVKGFKHLLIKNGMSTNYSYIFLLIIYTLSLSQGFLLTSVFISIIFIRSLKFNEKRFIASMS